jgi:tetratricopeptide (TPR) repeat protein
MRPPPLWLSAALIAATVGLVYHDSLDHPFVWTDHAEIEQGALVPDDLEELGRMWLLSKGRAKPTARAAYATREPAQRRWDYWRPVKAMTYGLDQAVGGGRPWSYHLTNLLLHAGACLALLLALRRITGPRWPGVAEGVALLQAVAPLHVEAVAWISARSDVLVAGCGWLAVWAMLRGRSAASAARAWGWRAAAALLVVLAIGAKESGLVWVGILALVSGWIAAAVRPRRPGHRDRNRSAGLRAGSGRPGRLGSFAAVWRRLLRECGLPAAAAAAIVGWRLAAVGDIQLAALGGDRALGFWSMLDLLGHNLFHSFVPLGGGVADTVRRVSGPTAAGLAGALLLAAWWFAAWRLRRVQPLVLLAAAGWTLAILPVAQIVELLHPRGDRYLYLPAAFAGLVWASALRALADRWAPGGWRRGLALLLLAVGVTGLAAQARAELAAWADERRLFARAVARQPHCIECWNNLAFAEARAGRYRRAVVACRTALAIDRSRFHGARDPFSLHWILAKALLLLDRGAEAVVPLERMVVHAGAAPATLAMLAQAYLQAGRPAHALAAAERALARRPGDRRLRALVYTAARAEHDAGFPWLFRFPEGCVQPEAGRTGVPPPG